jgi:hypothetical protein
MEPSSGADSSLREWLADPRGQFRRWRRPKPLLGGSLLVLGGFAISYVPLQFSSELLLIGGAYTIAGLMFSVLVAFCGLAAITKPELSSIFGAFGIALSTLSIFGALGGFLVGTVVGTAGGVLCYAWEPPEGYEYDETTLAEASGFIWQETGGFIWQRSGGFIWQTDDAGKSAGGSGDDDADGDAEEDLSLEDRYKL